MNFKNFCVLIAGTVMIMGFGFYLVPADQRADTYVKCVMAIAGVFGVNFWIVCSIISVMLNLYFFDLWRTSRRECREKVEEYSAIIEELRKGEVK